MLTLEGAGLVVGFVGCVGAAMALLGDYITWLLFERDDGPDEDF